MSSCPRQHRQPICGPPPSPTTSGTGAPPAIPSVSLAGGSKEQGLLIASSEIGAQRAEVFGSMWTFALASLATLVLTGLVGWLVTGRLLRPVRRLREATE